MPALEHFFKEEKPRSTNLQRSQDVMNENVVSRFKASVVPGIKSGLKILNMDNSEYPFGWVSPAIGAVGKLDLGVDLFKVEQGQAFDLNGEQVLVPADTRYVASNPLLVDTQVPPEPTPKSTGNLSIEFYKSISNFDADTFVFIKYLQTTDTGVLPATVPGFHFEYPKRDDGYEVVLVGNATDAAAQEAAGALFIGFIKRFPPGHPDQGGILDGVVYDRYPDGSITPSFIRPTFGVDITAHAGNGDAHHNKAHRHSAEDGSAVIGPDGAVLLGQSSLVAYSTSSVTVALGVKTFVVPAGLEYSVGGTATITSVSVPSAQMVGPVTSYVGTSLVVEVSSITGSGTYMDWNIHVPADVVKVTGQDVLGNVSFETTGGVVRDLSLVDDKYALLPNNISTGPGGPVLVGAGSNPDSIILRQLRAGEKVLANGRLVGSLNGPTSGTDTVYPTLPLFIMTLGLTDTGSYWVVVTDEGKIDKVAITTYYPRDKFVVGSIAVVSGKITNNVTGFTDLRAFGSIGSKDLQDGSVGQYALDPAIYAAILASGSGKIRWIVQGVAQTTGDTPVVKTLLDRPGALTDVYIYCATPPTSTAGTGLEFDIRRNDNTAAGSVFTTRPKITSGRVANTPEGGIIMHVGTVAATLPDVGQINPSANTVASFDRLGMYITGIGDVVPGGDELLVLLVVS